MDVIRKAQPRSDQVHINKPLTNVSVAYIQSTDGFVHKKVFPNVPVEKQSDSYFIFDKNDWFRDEAKKRPPSTESAGTGYNISNDSYNCDVWAIHKDIDVRVRANSDKQLKPDATATKFVTQKMLMKAELEFVTKFLKAGVWGTDLTGGASGGGGNFVHWDDYINSDPRKDITTRNRLLRTTTGFPATGFLIGGEVWDILKAHPIVLESIKYTRQAVGINTALVAQVLDIPSLLIAEGVWSPSKEGAAAPVYESIVGKVGFLYHAPKEPGLDVPSAGYTFSWTGYGAHNDQGVTISKFWMNNIKSDRVEGEMAYDQKVTGKDLGVFFSGMIS